MKTGIRISALLVCLCVFLTACASKQEQSVEATPQKIRLCASFYPIYAITEALCEGVPDLELFCLADPQDGCLRNYSLSDRDAALLMSADGVIIGGRGLESYETALYQLGENGPAVAAIMTNMQLSDTAPKKKETDSGSHWSGGLPQLYMSVKGVMGMSEVLAAQLTALDPDNGQIYQDNLRTVRDKLEIAEKTADHAAAILEGRTAIVMNEAAVYTAEELRLGIALCVDRDSGERVYALDDMIDEMKASGAEVCLIEKQAPKVLVDALMDAGFAVARIDTMSTGLVTDGFEGMIDKLTDNAKAVLAAYEDISEGR